MLSFEENQNMCAAFECDHRPPGGDEKRNIRPKIKQFEHLISSLCYGAQCALRSCVHFKDSNAVLHGV